MRRTVALLFALSLAALCVIVAKPVFSSADAADGTWATKEPMHVARSNLGVAVVNGKIYAIGGLLENGVATGANEEYDPATDTWTLKKPMPTPRANFGVEVYQNKIYCIGGTGEQNKIHNGVNQVYDPATDTWETKAALPIPREAFSTVVFKNRIYVIGGIVGRDFSKESLGAYTGITHVYDPASDNWEKIAAIPNASFPEACAVINGEIYVISGSTTYGESVSFTSVYDEDSDSWASKAPMPVVQHGSAVVYDDKIYFMGGDALLQIYDPATDTWVEGARLPVEGVSHGAAFMTTGDVAPQRIYVVEDPLRIYDPERNEWTLGPSKALNRGYMGVAVLDDKIYAVGGFTSVFLGFASHPQFAETIHATNEVYTPVGYGTVPPVVDVVSPESQTYNVSGVSLNFTVSKPAVWMGYSLDGQDNVTVTGNVTIDGLSNGLHNVTVYARDERGNTGASETVSFSVVVPFPAVLVAASTASATLIGVGLLVYFKRHGRQRKE